MDPTNPHDNLAKPAVAVPVAVPVVTAVQATLAPAAHVAPVAAPVVAPVARPVTMPIAGVVAGASSMTLGILAVVFAFIPATKMLSLPMAGLAVVLALFGFVKNATRFAVCGLLAGTLALAIEFVDLSHIAKDTTKTTKEVAKTGKTSETKPKPAAKETPVGEPKSTKADTKKGDPKGNPKSEVGSPKEPPSVPEKTVPETAKERERRIREEIAKFEADEVLRQRKAQTDKEIAEQKKIEAEKAALAELAKKAEKSKIDRVVDALAKKMEAGTIEWTHGLDVTAQFHRKKMTAVEIHSTVKKGDRGDVVWISWKDLEHRSATVDSAESAARAKLQDPVPKGTIEAAFTIGSDGRLIFQRIVVTQGSLVVEAYERPATANRLYGWHKLFSTMK